ncbi:Rieske 2Fe-2S domain-containing protein [Marinibaculum pumilum]|uniref:Rieske 2Fe-2S domain-containing protein n=1 Tax=Marinibaculum pumilum TaxID=1766165 RepID=A0ABV7KYS3_9PROT
MSRLQTAYDMKPPSHIVELTEVGRGKPMGEYLRRFWHPVGLAADAGPTPRAVKVLGEELILFRDGQGRAGLLHPRCAHRGASLFYGKVEDRGIRCCYHGWLFDTEGHCLEQPCEPEMGVNRGYVTQPWYPVEERYGLVWAYLGPLDRKPLLPRYELLENLAEGEILDADDRSIGSGGPVIADFNWFQHFENIVDPFHVPVLHGTFSGVQFVDAMNQLPEVEFSEHETGVRVTSYRTLGDGKRLRRITETAAPTLRVVPSPRLDPAGPCTLIGWVLPMDDTSFRIYTVGRVAARGDLQKIRSRMNGKLWEELAPEEHQLFPGDYEAQKSQGDITWHSHEHLALSDRGISMLRRFMRRQVRIVAEGGDPAGVAFKEGEEWVRSPSGNFIEDVAAE